MTNPSKQVAIGFSASAFLTPKHLPADKLLEWVDNDDLKKLKPSAEQVRDAVLLCKQHGIQARFTGGLALSISGDFEALHTCFGARLMFDSDPNAKERQWFEDDAGAKQDVIKPVANHPLEKHIVRVVLESGIELTVQQPPPVPSPRPRFPGKPKAWDKRQQSDIWPHELRDRMRFKQTALSAVEQGYLRSLTFGDRFCVSLVDTGLNGHHPYFLGPTGGPLSIPTFQGASEPYPMLWPKIDRLQTDIRLMNTEFMRGWDALLPVLDAVTHLPAQLSIPTTGIGVGPVTSYDQKAQAVTVTDPTPRNDIHKAVFSNVRKLQASTLYRAYIATFPQQTRQLVQLLNAITSDPPGVLWKGTPVGQFNADLAGMFTGLRRFLHPFRERAFKIIAWLTEYAGDHYDYDGHGTGMAASIFGVARTAQVASFPALETGLVSDYLRILGSPGVELSSVFYFAAQWAENEYKESMREHEESKMTSPTPVPLVEYRIMSNSYSRSVNIPTSGEPAGDVKCLLNEWRMRVKALNRKKFSVLFSAGNSGSPSVPDVSLYALLGKEGAIIVGGAWDNVDGQSSPRIVTLSSAAHGLKVTLPTASWFARARPVAVIPDVCGFVGPQITTTHDQTFWPPNIDISPYVYIPTKDNGWHYAGGGTSSACAQIAGLCGALRAKYTNLDPLEIKKAIMQGGDTITAGNSYQAKSPTDLDDVKLANILGAFEKAAEFSAPKRAKSK